MVVIKSNNLYLCEDGSTTEEVSEAIQFYTEDDACEFGSWCQLNDEIWKVKKIED